MDLDFGGLDAEECDGLDQEMSIGELIEWRYFKAEKAKESVSPLYENSIRDILNFVQFSGQQSI